jgi:hypothetical protein
MSSILRLSINSPKVISDTIDGEVVIVNLDKGFYYSLDGIGAEVWRLMVQEGHDLKATVQEIALRHLNAPKAIQTEIVRLIAELEQEEILLPTEGEAVASDDNPDTLVGEDPTMRSPFQPLVLHKYVDMQEMLLLDPIHEVDDTGWPNKKAGADE